MYKWLLIAAVSWFLLVSTPLTPNLLLNSLEGRYAPVDIERLSEEELEAEYHIIVLGGGHGFDERLPPNSLLSLNALGRLAEGIRLYRQLPNSILVLSGYSESGRTTQAEMLKNTALLLGVEEDRILLQKEPGNTYQEAKVFSERFTDTDNVILVTSAAHMPRAVMMFHTFEIKVIPSPANYRLKAYEKSVLFGFPSIRNICNMRVWLHEYAGILRYQLFPV